MKLEKLNMITERQCEGSWDASEEGREKWNLQPNLAGARKPWNEESSHAFLFRYELRLEQILFLQ